jgi:Ca-activated chloride channel family protein
MRVVSVAATLVLGLLGLAPCAASQDQSGSAQVRVPTFRSGVDMVTVAAVVRDAKGRMVASLKREHFQVIDRGEIRPIKEFRPDEAPISIAILLDVSGSMSVAANDEAAKRAAANLTSWLEVGRDEFALFTFDTRFQEIQPFTNRLSILPDSLNHVESFGMTSLHDAIAETARRVAARGAPHRAVVVLTDGIDTSSTLTADRVAGIASAIDVPVYILAVVSPLDHADLEATVTADRSNPAAGGLANLAALTGGGLFVSSKAEDSVRAAREIASELRHQYLIAFEPGIQPGWHPLEIRVRDRQLTVRARGGYVAAPPRQGQDQ